MLGTICFIELTYLSILFISFLAILKVNYNIQRDSTLPMKWILPTNEPFKNFKELSSMQGESFPINSRVNEDKEDQRQTNQREIRVKTSEESCELNSKKRKRGQISFQKHFLHQHTATFKKQVQNFLEHELRILRLENLKEFQTIRKRFFTEEQSVSLRDELNGGLLDLPGIQMNQFLLSLHEAEDLQNFLNSILQLVNILLSRWLITISISIWIQFRNQDFRFLERNEVLEKSRSWLRKNGQYQLQLEAFSLIRSHIFGTVDVRKQKSGQGQMQFLSYFSNTVLLIMAGYFQNPYSDHNFTLESESTLSYPKRQLSFYAHDFSDNCSDFSDDEDSFLPKKVAKTK